MALFSKMCLLLLLSLSLAYDISERKLLGGELGVELDYDFARFRPEGQEDNNAVSYKKRNWVYSSHLRFKNYVSTISSGQLRPIAHDAFTEMKQVMVEYGLTLKGEAAPAQTPYVMTILAFGSEIMLSSSQKGADIFAVQWGHSPVRKALERCQAAHRVRQPGESPRHANGGGCGEVLAVEYFYQLYPDITPFPRKARILAVEQTPDKSGYRDKLPCPGNDPKTNRPIETQWGCREFAAEFHLDVIPNGDETEPYGNIHELAGGLLARDHVPLKCADNP